MKRFLTALFSLCLLVPAIAQEEKEDKIGTANMARLVSEYYKTKAMRETFSGYQAEVIAQRDERAKAIKAAIEEAKKAQLEGQVETLSPENRSEYFEKAAKKQKEAQSLRADLMGWLQRRQSAMDEKAAMELAAIRKEVLAIIQKVGSEEGYDYIFDRSGASMAGVSVLVYTKDATDLTGVLLSRINEDAPKEGEEKKDAEDQ